MDLERAGREARRLVITAHQLDYGDTPDTRLLLAVLRRHRRPPRRAPEGRPAARKGAPLPGAPAPRRQQPADHRQRADAERPPGRRRLEARSHLYDAHSRVMSVATLQQQLAASQVGDVQLRDYFTDLCQSIGASMIHDHDKLRLTVEADESVADADVSVSLGLIVTELVINALKHAFPLDAQRRHRGQLPVQRCGLEPFGARQRRRHAQRLGRPQAGPRHQHRRGPGQAPRRQGPSWPTVIQAPRSRSSVKGRPQPTGSLLCSRRGGDGAARSATRRRNLAACALQQRLICLKFA